MDLQDIKNIQNHYDSHLDFYEQWTDRSSGGYHFGFPKKFAEIFNNQRMITNLSDLVIEELQIQNNDVILDAGCGAGHVAFRIEEKKPEFGSKIFGVTLSRFQHELALRKVNEKNSSVEIFEEDFEKTHFEDSKFDKIYFIDSLCHGTGAEKSLALKEMARIMKTGGVMVIADVFLEKQPEKLSKYFQYINRKVTKAWSVEEWIVENEFLREAKKYGFEIKKETDLTLKIPPSVMYAPLHWLPYSLVKSVFNTHYALVRKTLLHIGFFAPLLGIHPRFHYKAVVLQKR